jgi:hypothetical protein
MSLEGCPSCRGVGYVDVVPCTEAACVLDTEQQHAAEQLAGAVPMPALFRGGTFKISVAIKGFEVTDELAKAISGARSQQLDTSSSPASRLSATEVDGQLVDPSAPLLSEKPTSLDPVEFCVEQLCDPG